LGGAVRYCELREPHYAASPIMFHKLGFRVQLRKRVWTPETMDAKLLHYQVAPIG